MTKELKLLLFLLLLLGITAYFFRLFLNNMPQWNCISISDPFHGYYEALNLSWPIFTLTYFPLLPFIFFSLKNIKRLNVFALGYVFILFTRMLCIWLFPLCEPGGNHHLDDGFLSRFIYPDGYTALDLMYSGHTATVFLMALCSAGWWRYCLMTGSMVVGTMLVLQKVHYTLDVLAAFPAAFLCYWLAQKILNSGSRV